MLQIPLKNIDLQDENNILVTKQWKFRISVPMSYISFCKRISYDTLGLRSEGYPCGPDTLKSKVGRVPLPKLGMILIRVPTVVYIHRIRTETTYIEYTHRIHQYTHTM